MCGSKRLLPRETVRRAHTRTPAMMTIEVTESTELMPVGWIARETEVDREGTGDTTPIPNWGYSSGAAFLSRDEEARLIRRAQSGERRALERLIEANVRLVYSIARRYRCRSHAQEDLVQEGILGLVMAIERFDERHGCR